MALSRKNVDQVVSSINARLRNDIRIEAQGRNGKLALDLYDGTQCLYALHVGTTREVYTYLDGFQNALDITNR